MQVSEIEIQVVLPVTPNPNVVKLNFAKLCSPAPQPQCALCRVAGGSRGSGSDGPELSSGRGDRASVDNITQLGPEQSAACTSTAHSENIISDKL